MVTITGKSGRMYEVKSQLYGTSNLVHRLYFGGIFLAGTDCLGPEGESSSSLETTLERAEERVSKLGIEISE